MAGPQKTVFKVVKHDKYTARVSLRADWTKQAGIAAGDQVTQEIMPDGSLVIRPVRKSVVA
jgi:antitoxin component of MazEF toxin-antitoxin module